MFTNPFFTEINNEDSSGFYRESNKILCGNWLRNLNKKRLSVTARNAEQSAEDFELIQDITAAMLLARLLAEGVPQNPTQEQQLLINQTQEQELPQNPAQEENLEPAIPKRDRGFDALNLILPQQFDPRIQPTPPLLPLTGKYAWAYAEKYTENKKKKKPKKYLPELQNPIVDKKDGDKDPDSEEQRDQPKKSSYRASKTGYAQKQASYYGNKYSYRPKQYVLKNTYVDKEASAILWEKNMHSGTLAVLGLGIYNKFKLSHNLYEKISTYATAIQWLDYIEPNAANCIVGAGYLFTGSVLVKHALVSMGIKLVAPQIAAKIIQHQYTTLLVNLKTFGGALHTLKSLGKV